MNLFCSQRKAAKEKIQKDITENRELITKNDEMRRLEEWEEDMVTAIMAETKKILTRTRQLKEIEVYFYHININPFNRYRTYIKGRFLGFQTVGNHCWSLKYF